MSGKREHRAAVEAHWNVDYTCPCGLHVHPENPLTNSNAIHIDDCPWFPEPQEIALGETYKVRSMPGMAFVAVAFEICHTEESWELDCEEDHEHEEMCGYFIESEPYDNTDNVYVVAVGDDYRHLVDASELDSISEDDYCKGCGATVHKI